jgi:Icc-related predicted phosphoesterase
VAGPRLPAVTSTRARYRILAIADEVEEALYTDKLTALRPDIVLSCGDLPFDYLEYIVSRLDVPLVYVPGNHDPALVPDPMWTPLRGVDPVPGPQGCDNADGRVLDVLGLRIMGLGGSIRYRPGGPNQYTQAQMRRRALALEVRLNLKRVRRVRKLDVLVTHAPPFGNGPPEDPAHVGFVAFNRILKTFGPALHVHGHVRPYGPGPTERRLDGTRIINVIPWRLIDL